MPCWKCYDIYDVENKRIVYQILFSRKEHERSFSQQFIHQLMSYFQEFIHNCNLAHTFSQHFFEDIPCHEDMLNDRRCNFLPGLLRFAWKICKIKASKNGFYFHSTLNIAKKQTINQSKGWRGVKLRCPSFSNKTIYHQKKSDIKD